jgi:hypothetical protein
MKPVYDYSYLLPKDNPILIRSKGTVPYIPTINIPTESTSSNTLAPKAENITRFQFTDIKGNTIK